MILIPFVVVIIIIECVLRLSNGAFDWQGIVYVRIKGEWRGVCHNSFDEIDAMVACRQLGYDNVLIFGIFREVNPIKYWIDDLQCSGSENKLCDCPSSGIGQVDGCGAYNGVEVSCSCKPYAHMQLSNVS